MLSINVDDICPNQCSDNGHCLENIGCICKTGFITNDCSIQIKCKDDCNNKGICYNNGKCGCFPGWEGSTCETKINCPKNCTSFENGICLPNGKCQCKNGFEGVDCSNFKLIKKDDIKSDIVFTNFNELNTRQIKYSKQEDKLYQNNQSNNYTKALNETFSGNNHGNII